MFYNNKCVIALLFVAITVMTPSSANPATWTKKASIGLAISAGSALLGSTVQVGFDAYKEAGIPSIINPKSNANISRKEQLIAAFRAIKAQKNYSKKWNSIRKALFSSELDRSITPQNRLLGLLNIIRDNKEFFATQAIVGTIALSIYNKDVIRQGMNNIATRLSKKQKPVAVPIVPAPVPQQSTTTEAPTAQPTPTEETPQTPHRPKSRWVKLACGLGLASVVTFVALNTTYITDALPDCLPYCTDSTPRSGLMSRVPTKFWEEFSENPQTHSPTTRLAAASNAYKAIAQRCTPLLKAWTIAVSNWANNPSSEALYNTQEIAAIAHNACSADKSQASTTITKAWDALSAATWPKKD